MHKFGVRSLAPVICYVGYHARKLLGEKEMIAEEFFSSLAGLSL